MSQPGRARDRPHRPTLASRILGIAIASRLVSSGHRPNGPTGLCCLCTTSLPHTAQPGAARALTACVHRPLEKFRRASIVTTCPRRLRSQDADACASALMHTQHVGCRSRALLYGPVRFRPASRTLAASQLVSSTFLLVEFPRPFLH